MGKWGNQKNEVMDIFELKDKKQLGEELKAKREAKELSKYFFQQNGLRQEALNSIEGGTKKYSIDSLFKYLDILKMEA